MNDLEPSSLLRNLVQLIDDTKTKVAITINRELTLLYWNIGQQINDDILKNGRAEYGKNVITTISIELTKLFGSGFSKRNIQNFIKFHTVIEDITILHTLCAKLSWSHLRQLIYIENVVKREFYIQLCVYERWSARTLSSKIDSMLFERTAISKKPEETILHDLALLGNEGKITPDLVFRDPYFLDILGLHDSYSEKDLESAILSNLQGFISEMGSDFAFLARQKRIIIDNEDFYIDLLFYHRGLQRLVVIDLKLTKFKAAYKGQMELYLRWLEENEQRQGENRPIGLILCSEKSPEQIKYLTLDNNEQIKVAEYITAMPDNELIKEKLMKAIQLAQEAHLIKL